LDGKNRLALSADGGQLAVTVAEAIELWDTHTRKRTASLQVGSPRSVPCLEFIQDTGQVVLAKLEGERQFWDTATMKHFDGRTVGVRGILPPRRRNYSVYHAVSRDGKRVAWYDFKTNRAQVRELLSDLELMNLPNADAPALALSPDGSLLALLSPGRKQAQVWDVNAECLVLANSPISADEVRALAFSPDGGHLALLNLGDTVSILDVASGNNRVLLHWPQKGVNCLEFTPDGKRLLVGVDRTLQQEGALLVFDVGTGKEIVTLPLPFPVKELRFSKNGRCLAVTDQQKHLRVLETGSASALERRDAILVRRPAWHMTEAMRCESAGNHDGAYWHLERIPSEDLNNPTLLLLRARLRNDRGQWQSAAGDLERALEFPEALKDRSANELYPLAWAALKADNLKAYRGLCTRVTPIKLADDRNGIAAADQVRLLTLGPQAVDDYAPVVKLAEQAVAVNPTNTSFLFSLGCAYFRAGRFEDGIARLMEHRASEPNWAGHAVTSLMVALAHHQLGNSFEAQAHYARASAWIQEHTKDLPPDQVQIPKLAPRTAMLLDQLRRETDAVFALPKPPSNKP
jgi:tetratricopeptide (TPR) repeat protein